MCNESGVLVRERVVGRWVVVIVGGCRLGVSGGLLGSGIRRYLGVVVEDFKI